MCWFYACPQRHVKTLWDTSGQETNNHHSHLLTILVRVKENYCTFTNHIYFSFFNIADLSFKEAQEQKCATTLKLIKDNNKNIKHPSLPIITSQKYKLYTALLHTRSMPLFEMQAGGVMNRSALSTYHNV